MKSGQSFFEYILLVVIVVLVWIVFLKPQGLFSQKLNGVLDQSLDFMNKEFREEIRQTQ